MARRRGEKRRRGGEKRRRGGEKRRRGEVTKKGSKSENILGKRQKNSKKTYQAEGGAGAGAREN